MARLPIYGSLATYKEVCHCDKYNKSREEEKSVGEPENMVAFLFDGSSGTCLYSHQ